MNHIENKLFSQISKGNKDAFEFFFKEYYTSLYNYAVQITKDSAISEEIIQDVFMSIWEKRKSIKIEVSPKVYLFKSVYNRCINHLRHKGVVNRHQAFFTHHMLNATDHKIPESFPLSRLINQETEKIVAMALRNLPKQCRKVFIMSRFQNKKNAMIAKELGIQPTTVKTQKIRALKKIEFYLADYLSEK